jgi:hypothetical protein
MKLVCEDIGAVEVISQFSKIKHGAPREIRRETSLSIDEERLEWHAVEITQLFCLRDAQRSNTSLV